MRFALLAAAAAIVAMPALAQQGVSPLNQLVDESIGYVNIGPGLLLIEDEQSSHICKIIVVDAYFRAYAAGNRDAMNSSRPEVICVPTAEFIQ